MQRLIHGFRAWLQRPAGEPDLLYRVFTRDFDQTVNANALDGVLGPVSASTQAGLEEAWDAFMGALQGWRTKLQLTALDASARIRAETTEEQRADTVVSVLIDHSGSMRGQNILLAATAADVVQDFLGHLGIGAEVLGFTTVSWKGGRSRRSWLLRGRPRNPGRLCDLLHIVYRSGDDGTTRGAGWSFRPMLRPDLLKENVDGEALQWAVSRLRACGQSRKILLVISDGAPVDDSTLLANDVGYLDRHLRAVVSDLEASEDILVAAIGIGTDASRYYSRAVQVAIPEELGTTALGLLEALILQQGQA